MFAHTALEIATMWHQGSHPDRTDSAPGASRGLEGEAGDDGNDAKEQGREPQGRRTVHAVDEGGAENEEEPRPQGPARECRARPQDAA